MNLRIVLTADPMLPVPPVYYGGIERVVDLLARGLVARGHHVTLVAHAASETAGRLIPYGTERPSGLGALRNALTVSRAVVERPDIVHSFGRLATLAPLLRAHIPKVMSYQREPSDRMASLAARIARRGTLAFTGCSEWVAARLRPFAPATTVFNGVSLASYPFCDRIGPDAPLVFLGRVERIKGAHTAIAVAKAAGRRLVIAGNVPPDAQAFFDAEVQPYVDGDRVRFVGPVDDAQKAALLGDALALLMPIEWEEPFGIVMAEALACGTPVVGTPRGAVPEVVRNGMTGWLAPDVSGLVDAVGRLGRISRAACRADAEARFSADVMVDSYLALYNERITAAKAAR